MLRLLSWTGCDKINSPEMRMFVPHKDSPGASGNDVTVPPSLKRKQGIDHHSQPDRKRTKLPEKVARPSAKSTPGAAIMFAPPTAPVLAADDNGPSSLPTPPEVKQEESEMIPSSHEILSAERLDSVRRVIQTQMSLEILLKHNELRLIDQEIAKAQVALEQLRRCTELPYPATRPPSLAVSNGTGLSRRSSYKTALPMSPAPWGVVDGPYSRHYAQWLLPSSHFDGGEPESIGPDLGGKAPMKSRSMRGSLTESPLVMSNSARTQRSGKLKALPAGYGQPKEKATGPMILKRKSDGVQVKLVCPDCGRHDFGSAQGFINHCRIGHGRSFASHDAAAEACGEPVEYDQSGAMVGVEPVAAPSVGNVHPLIRSAKLMQPPSTFPAKFQGSSALPPKPKSVSPDFKASSLTPHLSDLVKNSGLGIDLQQMVTSAKEKVVMPDVDSEDSDESDVEVPMQETTQGRHPQVAGSKQLHKPAKSTMSSPMLSHNAISVPAIRGGGTEQSDRSHHNFIHTRPQSIPLPDAQDPRVQLPPADPSPVSESNQAPSLVDDDEEYEAHSPDSSSVCDEHDMGEVEFDVQDDEDDSHTVLPKPEFQTSCASARPHPHSRRPSAIRRHGEDREEKHVSFVSPSPAREIAVARQSNERKRKKP